MQAVGEELTGERQQAWQDWLQQYKAVLRGEGQSDELRIQLQNSANPCYIPRNHLLQVCIDQAEKGDFTEVGSCISSLQDYRLQLHRDRSANSYCIVESSLADLLKACRDRVELSLCQVTEKLSIPA